MASPIKAKVEWMGSQKLRRAVGSGIGSLVNMVAEKIKKIVAKGVKKDPRTGTLYFILTIINTPTKDQEKKEKD
jgi:uncharacterized protein YqgC (DUF456 family)